MAPVVLPTIVTIIPWPHFQAFADSLAAIGAQLYSYVPATSTPKATFVDPGSVTPNPWPVVLDDQGAATVYLQGTTDLRLFDAEGVLLWSVDAYTWESGFTPPGPGDLIMGSTDATVSASPGASTIPIPGLVPLGYRVRGLTWTITDSFGTSGGLTGIALGDSVALDRWGLPPALTAGTTGGQQAFRAGDEPIATPASYVVLIAALGGRFDATGGLHVTAYWESLPADVP
jgi:hypothetical protein